MQALLLLTLLAANAAAFAQPVDFEALDSNADGVLSRPEVAANPELVRRFGQFDADKDRRWSRAEHAAAREDNERRAVRDAALTARVKAALIAERGIRSTAISIDTYEGEVQLSGFVPAPDMASLAGRVTAGVSGVRTVHNNLLVRQK